MDNNILFLNIIKNSGPDFNCKEELKNLHLKQLENELSIKLRKDIEYKFNQLKLEEVNERIDEYKFQKKFFKKRNNNILEKISKNSSKFFELASDSAQSQESIYKNKQKYQNYLDSLLPKFQNDFSIQIFSQENEFLKEKNNELNKLKQNESRKQYFDTIINIRNQYINEINNLKQKNTLLSLQNQEKEKIYLEKDKNFKTLLSNQSDNDNNNFQNIFVNDIINYNKLMNENKNNNDYNNINEEEKKLRSENLKIPKGNVIKQYVLNQNHIYGKLDELTQERLNKKNEELKRQNYQANQIKESLNESSNSLDDLRRQVLPPSKQINFIPEGTLNQNFDSNININVKINEQKEININNNIKEDNINNNENNNIQNKNENQNNPTPGESINNNNINIDLNNNNIKINNDSNFNVLISNNNINNNVEEKKKEKKKENSNSDNGSDDKYKDYDIAEVTGSKNSNS